MRPETVEPDTAGAPGPASAAVPPDLGGLLPGQRRALLSRLLAEQQREPGTGQRVPDHHPTSFPQQRMWFVHRLEPTTRAYHVESVTPIEGGFDASALERALNRVVARHAVLRTTFIEVDGEP